MQIKTTDRGFRVLAHPFYRGYGTTVSRVVQESSAVGDYPDAMDNPGSSCLWVGDDHHLNREQVAVLVAALQAWLSTGRLPESVPAA